MKNLLKYKRLLTCGLVLGLASCDDDGGVAPPAPVNEEELITTMRIEMVPQGGSATKIFLFKDLDGDGGNQPVITTDVLDADSIYSAKLTLLNEQESPAADITVEVKAEGEEHQFFYQVMGGADMTVSYADADNDAKPIGIETKIIAISASSGVLKVTLRHGPNKTAAHVEAGDITNAGGETDIEVDFPVTIQ